MRSHWGLTGFLISAALLAGVSARGGIVLNSPETWSTIGQVDGWQTMNSIATLSNPSGYLNIQFGAQSPPPQYAEDIIYNPTAYSDNYQLYPGLGLSFSFYAQEVLPLSSVLYLHSAVDNSIWEYDFNNSVAGAWQSQSIPFSYGAGWIGPGDATTFWNDLANVDWVGVDIARNLNTMAQDYGIDNWSYFVPEPASTAALATALISLAAVFRKKLVVKLLPG